MITQQQFITLVDNASFVGFFDGDIDSFDGPSPCRPVSPQDCYADLQQYRWIDECDLSSLAGVKDALAGVWDAITVVTDAELRQREEAQERQELDSYVSRLCQSKGVNATDTVAVLDALSGELDRLESYREGMREDGLCIGYGVSAEQWSDEHNASMGDSDKASRALSWVASNAPLAYAKWSEKEEE